MKRFTETDKWRDSWFRKLKPLSKLAFIYIVDNCDAAGVWDPDFELADFAIGEDVPWEKVKKDFGERLVILSGGKWFLTRFVEFQYGILVPECRPHAKVLQLLTAHGIGYEKGIVRVSEPYKTRQEEDRTIQDKDRTGQDPAADASPAVDDDFPIPPKAPTSAPAETTPPEPETPPEPTISAETIYDAYPRKEGRQDALKAIAKAMKRFPAEKLLGRTRAYAAAVHEWPPEDNPRFVPHPSTWFNGGRYEDDPATWERRPQHTQGRASFA